MKYQICTNCVMDTSDPDITFDGQGVCSWCHKIGNPKVKEGLKELLGRVRLESNGYYDCVIGLSGGVDSSYLAHLVVKVWGLRPLAVVVDCAWGTDEARQNIHALEGHLGLEDRKYTYLGDDFLDLQLSYLKAGVLNLDVPQDHAIVAALWQAATDNNIKYILTGHNNATESIHPPAWGFPCMDLTNIRAIHREFGNGRTKQAMPTMSWVEQVYCQMKGIKVLNPLDYVPYNRQEAKELLEREYGWQDYGQKHHESMFTRWYQCHILPSSRLRIDKRRSHLSALILSGQTTRSEALAELEKPPCTQGTVDKDEWHIAEALGICEHELERLLVMWPKRDHREFATDPRWARYLQYAVWRLRG